MCLDDKNIGSLTCAACNKSLKDHEFVVCAECEGIDLEEDISDLLDETAEAYLEYLSKDSEDI